MNKTSLAISLLAVIVSIIALVSANNAREELRQKNARSAQSPVVGHDHEEEHVEVAAYMATIQRFNNKLYAASSNGNAALVNFYLHEMEETMEELIDAEPKGDDGFDLVGGLEVYGLSALKKFKEGFAANGKRGAQELHEQLVLSCNSCHAASGHPFLRMAVPTEVNINGQDMSAQ